MTVEYCHQRWFLSNRQMQGMLVIAEAEVGNCVRERDASYARQFRVLSSQDSLRSNERASSSALRYQSDQRTGKILGLDH